MTYHILYEDQYERLYDMELYDVGDSIVYIPNNQLGYMKYKVIVKDGKKELEAKEDINGEL